MKKILCVLLAMAMTLCLATSVADDFSLDVLENVTFLFSSGVGAWSTELFIDGNGNYSGYFMDSDMGDCADAYPLGTVNYCSFEGTLALGEMKDLYTVSLSLLTKTVFPMTETVDEGIRYVPAPAYGIENAAELELYLPGKPVSELPEEYLEWAALEEGTTALPFYGLYNPQDRLGFVGYETEYSEMVEPIESDLDVENLPENCTLVASLSENAVVGEFLSADIWTEEYYSQDDVLGLDTGDFLYAMGQVYVVQDLEEVDGEVQVNGGYFDGQGVTFWPVDGDLYRVAMENDATTYRYEGEAILPLGEKITMLVYRVSADGELLDGMDEYTVTGKEFSALLDQVDDTHRDLYDSLLEIELQNGAVVKLVFDYRP